VTLSSQSPQKAETERGLKGRGPEGLKGTSIYLVIVNRKTTGIVGVRMPLEVVRSAERRMRTLPQTFPTLRGGSEKTRTKRQKLRRAPPPGQQSGGDKKTPLKSSHHVPRPKVYEFHRSTPKEKRVLAWEGREGAQTTRFKSRRKRRRDVLKEKQIKRKKNRKIPVRGSKRIHVPGPNEGWGKDTKLVGSLRRGHKLERKHVRKRVHMWQLWGDSESRGKRGRWKKRNP